METKYAAKANQRNAQAAWPMRHCFSLSSTLWVIELWMRKLCYRQHHTPQREREGTYPACTIGSLRASSQNDPTRQEPDGVQDIQDDHDPHTSGPLGLDGRRDQEEQEEYRKGRGEHGIVLRSRVPAWILLHHGADDAHDESRPYELPR